MILKTPQTRNVLCCCTWNCLCSTVEVTCVSLKCGRPCGAAARLQMLKNHQQAPRRLSQTMGIDRCQLALTCIELPNVQASLSICLKKPITTLHGIAFITGKKEGVGEGVAPHRLCGHANFDAA
uniref:Uncharacterized protein n=1 Tax=Rhipicephalus zambeziensis TaxID=60191 RepID=A0A224YFY7_9ACAR